MSFSRAGKVYVENSIDELKPFKRGNMTGHTIVKPWSNRERLIDEWRKRFNEDAMRADIIYGVWSYNTPIGWKLRNGEWIIPDTYYSKTTKVHQDILKNIANKEINV